MVKKSGSKKPLRIVTAILSLCLIFTAIIPSANASAVGSFDSSCSGPAGLLKWLVCPAVDGLTEVLESLYDSAKTQLTIPTSMITDSKLNEAWGVSRDLANVLFIMLFLVVIFSQLTGIGIDNYGIKKILPRLITCAILINLSFIICELLVDVSNIIGGSIDTWLTQLGANIQSGAGISQTDPGVYALHIGVLFITPIGATVTLGFIIALIIALFHGIGAAITLLFIAVVRKISIILLIALSPLAFAAYLLPNTEKLFKKWADWMKSILIIYPICSILVGGGALAGAVLNAGITNSGTSSNFEVLVAMVAPLLPLWFLPKFLKGSLASLGVMGKAVSDWRNKRALGRKRRTQKALQTAKSSAAYKSAVNTAKLKVATSGAGKRVNSVLGGWATNTGSGKGDALKRVLGQSGKNAYSETVAKATTENNAIDQKNRENRRYTDTRTMTAYLNSNDELVSAGTAGATATTMTAGEYYRRMQEQRLQKDDELYSSPDYLQHVNASYDAQRSATQTKMFQENYTRLNTDELKHAFEQALRAAPGSANQGEQIAAAIRVFAQTGQMDKARDVMEANAAQLHAFANSSAENRNTLMRELGGAGDWISKEYSKHLGKQGSAAKSFADWANADDRDASGNYVADASLAASLSKQGVSALSGLDKDSIEYVTNHSHAMSAVSNKAFVNAAATATNGEIITKLTNAINGLDPGRKNAILANTAASQFVTMNENLRVAISGGDDSKWVAQVGAAIRDNPQIADHLNASERARYAAPPTP